jgi:ferric iron reductase protein FhuF
LLAETGEVDQVPTQWASELLAMAELVAMKEITSNDARKWREERRIVRAIWSQVYWRMIVVPFLAATGSTDV